MRKLPRIVTVFGRKLPIIQLSSEEIKKAYPDFQQAPQGLWDSCNRKIVINKDFPIEDQFYTLFHELAHASFTFSGVDLVIQPELQEVIVQTVATLTEDVLAQSKALK